jgi:hypothetical protein
MNGLNDLNDLLELSALDGDISISQIWNDGVTPTKPVVTMGEEEIGSIEIDKLISNRVIYKAIGLDDNAYYIGTELPSAVMTLIRLKISGK